MTKKSKEILDIPTNGNFMLMAISSQLNLNKLVWELNSRCELKLQKDTELDGILQVPTFSDKTTETPNIVTLISNKYEGKLLVKQLGNVDYILEISGMPTPSKFKEYIQEIKKIQGTIAAIEIAPSSIKRKEPFCPE